MTKTKYKASKVSRAKDKFQLTRRTLADFPKQERRVLNERSIGDTVQLLITVPGYKDVEEEKWFYINGVQTRVTEVTSAQDFPLANPGDYGSYQGQENLVGVGEVCVIQLKHGVVKLADDGTNFVWTD